MKRTKYICFEGTDGCYKTTNVQALVEHLRQNGFKVLQTKEPGTPLIPVTMMLRNIMLNNEFANVLTPQSRELISQAIKSIHLQYLEDVMDEYDYVIQDRGILSGIAYAKALGMSDKLHMKLLQFVHSDELQTRDFSQFLDIYDLIIHLSGDIESGLEIAKKKDEFASGDYMESQGSEYMKEVSEIMFHICGILPEHKVATISVKNKSKEKILEEIVEVVKNV